MYPPHTTRQSSTSPSPACGTLYGIGVGPGAPDLISLRAVTVLRSIGIVLAAASPKNEFSLALDIALPHLPKDVTVMRLDFPMTRDKAALEEAWINNAEKATAVLRSGQDAAFLTLGDPLIYSTFGYLLRRIEDICPEAGVSIIPGITSYQEAAAKTRTVLCEGEENLLLVSGINSLERLEKALRLADSAVILKTCRNRNSICQALTKTGRKGRMWFVSRLGLEGECFVQGLENIPQNPHYLSLLLAPPLRDNKSAQPPL